MSGRCLQQRLLYAALHLPTNCGQRFACPTRSSCSAFKECFRHQSSVVGENVGKWVSSSMQCQKHLCDVLVCSTRRFALCLALRALDPVLICFVGSLAGSNICRPTQLHRLHRCPRANASPAACPCPRCRAPTRQLWPLGGCASLRSLATTVQMSNVLLGASYLDTFSVEILVYGGQSLHLEPAR